MLCFVCVYISVHFFSLSFPLSFSPSSILLSVSFSLLLSLSFSCVASDCRVPFSHSPSLFSNPFLPANCMLSLLPRRASLGVFVPPFFS